jgi:acyl-coenzyme A thioesterase PaaI-like protein
MPSNPGPAPDDQAARSTTEAAHQNADRVHYFEVKAANAAAFDEVHPDEFAVSPASWVQRLPLTDQRVAARDLGAAVRDLSAVLPINSASPDHLAAAAELVRQAHALVVEQPLRDPITPDERVDLLLRGDPEAWSAFDFNPMVGRASALAPPLEVTLTPTGVSCEVSFSAAYEGPPGCVHGGFIAAAFDEVLGAAQTLSGAAGMTGRLLVSYRSPTPLNEPLRIEATFDGRDGRKLSCSGRMFHGDTLTAEAEALFICLVFD